MWHERKQSGGEQGQSLVEIALVLPVLLICLLGTVDLGRAVYADITLSNAVREGGRAAVVITKTDAEIVQAVLNAAVGIGLTASEVTIGGSRQPGAVVIVSATHTFVLVTPLISQMVGSTLQMRAQSSMVVD